MIALEDFTHPRIGLVSFTLPLFGKEGAAEIFSATTPSGTTEMNAAT
jgi:hypothetical protein